MFGNGALWGKHTWGEGAVTSNVLGGRWGLSPEVLLSYMWEPLKDLKQTEGHN